MNENSSELNPKIYAICYPFSNPLEGRWIDMTKGESFVRSEIKELVHLKSANGWMVIDHQDFHPVHISTFPCIETLCELAEFIKEHGEVGREFLGANNANIDLARMDLESYQCDDGIHF